MFKLNKLSAAILCSAGSIGAFSAYAQENQEPIEEIVIHGIRGSLNAAADLKRTSNVIQDSIVAEDIGKFPDQNVAESLQRITGVSISRAGGEGAQISVRSFGPEFNIVRLNHRTLATTTGGRSFDFQILPSELIGGADVIKSPAADLSAGSIGAYVNVRSSRPLDNPGLNAVGAVKANYHDMSEEITPEISGLISNTFADDTVGVLVGLSYKETDGRIDNYRATIWNQYPGNGFGFLPNTIGEDGRKLADETGAPTTDMPGSYGPGRTIYTLNNENRERIGATAVLQWTPSDNVSHTLDLLYTKLELDRLGGGLQVPNQQHGNYTRAVVSDSGTLLEATIANTDLEMSVDTALSENTTSAIGLNSVFTAGALTLEFDAAYSKAEGDWEGDNSTALHHTFFDANGEKVYSEIHLDYSSDVPSLTTTGGLDITDPSKVRAAWQHFGASDVQDEITELKLDALYEIEAGVMQSVKAGVAYQDRTVSFNEYGTEFDGETGNESWPWPGAHEVGPGSTWGNDPAVGEVPDSLFSLVDGYMSGLSGNFPRQWVQLNNWAAYREAGQAAVEAVRPDHPLVQAGWDTLYKSAGSYENSEENISAYVMANLEGELGGYVWSGNVGVRYVDITNTAAGRASRITLLRMDPESTPPPIRNTADSAFLAPHSEETSEQHFLPSLNLKLDLGGGHILRTATSQTISRPNMVDAGVNYTESPSVEAPLVRISGGNPGLKSYEVTSFDLGYEFYAESDNAVSVTYFYKDITNFIATISESGIWDGPVDPALAAAYAEQGQVVQYQFANRKANRPGGTIQGLELGALYYFPGVMDGFGVQANYTFSDSEDKGVAPLNAPLVPEPGSALEGFAKHSYNLIGFYDKDAFQARVAYNWRDNFMDSRAGGDMGMPTYTDEYGQLDMSMSYDFTDNLTMSFEAINLTNETRLGYVGQRDRVTLVEMTGRRLQVGLRATF